MLQYWGASLGAMFPWLTVDIVKVSSPAMKMASHLTRMFFAANHEIPSLVSGCLRPAPHITLPQMTDGPYVSSMSPSGPAT